MRCIFLAQVAEMFYYGAARGADGSQERITVQNVILKDHNIIDVCDK